MISMPEAAGRPEDADGSASWAEGIEGARFAATRRPSADAQRDRVGCREVGTPTLIVVVFSAISGFLFGYDLCVINVALDLIASHFSLETSMKEAVRRAPAAVTDGPPHHRRARSHRDCCAT